VKRWKKLPAGSNRNWHHVVDARAGPGTKSMNKIKNKAKMEEKLLKKKHKHKHKKPKNNKPGANGGVNCRSSGGLSDDVADYYSDHSSQSGYLSNSDGSDDESSTRSKSNKRRKQSNPLQYSSFLDLNYWKKTEVCCGVIFKGPRGEVVIDMSLMHPCKSCKRMDESVAAAASDEMLSSPASPSDTAEKRDAQDQEALHCEETNDADIEDDDDIDDMDDDDNDEIVEELDLDEDMIGGNLDELEDDEGTDSGLGSQELSTAEGSPHPGPQLQTAAAVLHAMSTGTDLLPSAVASKASVISAESRKLGSYGDNSPQSSLGSSPALHSVTSSSQQPVMSAAASTHCIQIKMEV